MLVVLVGCGGRTDGPPKADAAEGVDTSAGTDAGSVDDANDRQAAAALCGDASFLTCVLSPKYMCVCGDSCADAGVYFQTLPMCGF